MEVKDARKRKKDIRESTRSGIRKARQRKRMMIKSSKDTGLQLGYSSNVKEGQKLYKEKAKSIKKKRVKSLRARKRSKIKDIRN